MKKKIYLFDFDGTLTTRDTLLAFICFAKGKFSFCLGMLCYAPLLVLMKLRIYPNYSVKQKVFAYFFKGMSLSDFDDCCCRFAEAHRDRLLRPLGRTAVSNALAEGSQVMIVSASIDNWVRPFFTLSSSQVFSAAETVSGVSHMAAPTVLGTRVETKNGILTGRFLTPNCYGPEKVNRIKEVLTASRSNCHLVAFGDSRGDKEMLAYADEGYFKPFR